MAQKNKGPTFICIGMQKTGTTWLNKNLRPHPQVFISPTTKEILYFWEKHFFSDENIVKRFTGSNWYYRRIQKFFKGRPGFYYKRTIKIFKRLYKIRNRKKGRRLSASINVLKLIKYNLSCFIWDIKFLFFPHTDRWYLSLFNSKHKERGDISPLYYQLPEDIIKRISLLLQGIKIIILLRNPVDMSWSKAKMNLCKTQNRKIENIPENEFHANFRKEFELCPSYSELIDRWIKYFGKGNVHINFYDKLEEDPLSFYEEICQFLEINPGKLPKYVKDNLFNKVHEGIDEDIPLKYSVFLAKLYDKCIQELCRRYDTYPQKWAEKCDFNSRTSNSVSSLVIFITKLLANIHNSASDMI